MALDSAERIPEAPLIVYAPADDRYHIVFSDLPGEVVEAERLGLMLTESGPIGFNVQMSSPFAGQLGGPGNREDKDLSRYSVRSQRDWRGGRGQLTAYTETDRFHDSLADTRFPNQVILPPAKTKAELAGSTDPEFTPIAASTNDQMAVSATWVERTRNNQTAHATWTQNIDTSFGYDVQATSTYRMSGQGQSLLQKFVPSTGVTVTQVTLRLARTNSDNCLGSRIVICSNTTTAGVDSPGTILWNHTIVIGDLGGIGVNPNWFTTTGDASVALVGGTKYWVGLYHVTGTSTDALLGTAYANYGQEGVITTGTGFSVTQRGGFEIPFKINNGPVLTDNALTRVRLAQKFTAAATNSTTDVQLLLTKTTWGAGSTLSVNIYTDSGGPSAIVGATGTVTMPTNTSEQQVTVPLVAALTSGSTYWLVLTPDAPQSPSGFANNISVVWGAATASASEAYKSTETGGSWGSWAVAGSVNSFFFYVNYSGGTHDYYYQYVKTITSRAQSFVTPASGTVTPTKVRLRLQRITWNGNATLTLGLYSNSGGLPNTLLKTATITKADFDTAGAVATPNWVEFSPGSPTGLTANTTYWLALVPTAPAITDSLTIQWQTDTAANYSGGSSSQQIQEDGTGSWAAGTTGTDGYFIINAGTGIASSVTIRPVQFSGGWYLAAGLNVYKFNTSTSQIDLKYTAAATITSLCSFGGSLYAAMGDSNDMVSSADGASWGAVTGRKYTHLLAYTGYLYAAKSVGGATAFAYFANATWSPNITLANSSVTISDLIGFQNEVIVTATTGIWVLSASLIYQAADFSNEQYAGNGVNSLTWMADGRLYIPIGQSLHAWTGTQLIPVGLDLEDGLPLDLQGHVSCLVGTRTFLFASVDGGTTSRSGIYAFNGKGWHCLAQASTPGRRIRSMGLEQITSSTSRPRLWYFEDGSPYFLEFPDLTDNPNGYLDSAGVGIAYEPTGYVTSSWIGGELAAISKDFQSIIVASTGCSTENNIDLFIEVDRSGILRPIGTVTKSPLQEFTLLGGVWPPIVITIKDGYDDSTTSTIIVPDNATIVLAPGEFVRIGSEIRQISTVDTHYSFTLNVPLSAAPAAGTYVYPARPAGREIRVKAVLNSSSPTVTPVLQRISVKMQEALLDKFRFTLSVRIEDAMRLHGSVAAADLYTAAELRAKLYQWIKRLNPFYMVAPGGTLYRVKASGASESGWTRTNQNGISSWRSVMSIILDEV